MQPLIVAFLLASMSQWVGAQVIRVYPITVCEALSNLHAYDGKRVAIVGKLDGGGLMDGCCGLVEDRCRQSIVTELAKHSNSVATSWVWENRINLRLPLPEGRANSDLPKFSFGGPAFDEKLRQMAMWTTLGCYSVPTFSADGKPTPPGRAQQQWAVAYGRLLTKKSLRGPSGKPGTSSFHWGNGFGHLGAAPAELANYEIQLIGSSECSVADTTVR